MRERTIIVGTDGTDSAMRAVEWAADEAQRRQAVLRIIHAFDWDWHGSRFEVGIEYIDLARQIADAVVAAAYDRARRVAPGLTIETDTLIGHAAPRLLEMSSSAQLLVLGNRGRGGFAGLLLGSVSQRLAVHAACPVVVVRGRETLDGPILAGVDDSPTADQVLAAAFAAATDRGCGLAVVHSYLPAVPLWLSNVRLADVDTPAQDNAERTLLEQRLAQWRGKHPDVPLEVVVTHDSAASALVGASRCARLVVVGSHRRGTLRGAVLGSAGLQLLHHAECPVLIHHQHSNGTAEPAALP